MDPKLLTEGIEAFINAGDYASLEKLVRKYPEAGFETLNDGTSLYLKCLRYGMHQLIDAAIEAGGDLSQPLIKGSKIGVVDEIMQSCVGCSDHLFKMKRLMLNRYLDKDLKPLSGSAYLNAVNIDFQRIKDLSDDSSIYSYNGMLELMLNTFQDIDKDTIVDVFQIVIDKQKDCSTIEEGAAFIKRIGLTFEHESHVHESTTRHASFLSQAINRGMKNMVFSLIRSGFGFLGDENMNIFKNARWSAQDIAKVESEGLAYKVEQSQEALQKSLDDEGEVVSRGLHRRRFSI